MALMAGTTVPGTVELVFNLEYNRLVNGQVDVFSIDASWKSIIGQQGIKVIAKKLENALFAYVRTFNKDDRIFMEVTELKTDPGSEEYLVGDKPIDWVKTPRPPNAFILYRQHHHESMKAKYPEYRNTDLSQIIGAKWKSETLSVQKYYREMARGIKEEHFKLFPEYSYRPRKSADKKRRMTMTKAARVDSLAQALVSKNDSVNNDFVPELSKPKPVLVEERFGNQNVSSFVLGDPNITGKELRSLIKVNNEKFPTAANLNAPAILTTAPAKVLEDTVLAHLATKPWQVYTSAHQVDGGRLDEDFAFLVADNTNYGPEVPRFGAYTEVDRQHLLDP